MSDEWAFMQSALRGDFGWLVGVTAWQTLLRAGMVFFNSKLKEFMENALPADKEWIQTMLNARWYRLTYFLINAFLSVKLPSVARKPTGNTETLTKT